MSYTEVDVATLMDIYIQLVIPKWNVAMIASNSFFCDGYFLADCHRHTKNISFCKTVFNLCLTSTLILFMIVNFF